MGPAAASGGSTACSRSRIWDRDERDAVPGARPLRRQAALLRARPATVPVRLRDQGVSSAHGALQAELDSAGLLEYFTFQNFFTDRTLFDGVKLLPPGTLHAGCSSATRRRRSSAYWDFAFRGARRARVADEEYLEELDRLFRQAVVAPARQRRRRSARTCSGGMDSGSITARRRAAAAVTAHVHRSASTCSSASGLELGFDEREPAEHMSYLFKTEHYEMVLKAGDMERVLPTLAWHLEEPRVGQCYPNYYAAQLAGEVRQGRAVRARAATSCSAAIPWRYYRAVVNDDFDALRRQVLPRSGSGCSRTSDAEQVFAPIWDEVERRLDRATSSATCSTSTRRRSTRPEDYVNHSLYFEAKTFLHGLLVVEDKLSHGARRSRRACRSSTTTSSTSPCACRSRLKLGNLGEVVRLDENEPGGKTRALLRSRRATASCCCAR